jgi:hypothetical protein
MKNEDILKNKIDYWKKHQELDKFNYNFISIFSLSLIAVMSSVLTPIMISLATKGSIIPSIIVSSILLISFFLIMVSLVIYQYRNNRAFKIREAMLRVWYGEKDIGIDTDKLDEIFEKIRQEYKGKMPNKEIENIARKIMNKKMLEEQKEVKIDYTNLER